MLGWGATALNGDGRRCGLRIGTGEIKKYKRCIKIGAQEEMNGSDSSPCGHTGCGHAFPKSVVLSFNLCNEGCH